MKLIIKNDEYFAKNCKALSREKTDRGRHAPSVMTVVFGDGTQKNVTAVEHSPTGETVTISNPFEPPEQYDADEIDRLEVIW